MYRRKTVAPPSGVSKSMVSLSFPALPWFSTRTPALMVENGHRSSAAPATSARRRRRCSGNMFSTGQGLIGGPVMTSLDLTSSGSSTRQYRICAEPQRQY